jgi:hypothetical protein
MLVIKVAWFEERNKIVQVTLFHFVDANLCMGTMGNHVPNANF